ncbi:MAG: sulfatase/phosphatase domain-containing protein, partial [Verrucomicrobiota bacterium]
RESTLILFTSDNGPWNQPAYYESKKGHPEGSVFWGTAEPLRAGKGSAYEGGSRVPCIASWTGKIPAGKVSDAMFATLDFLPTFANLAGFEVPKDRVIDGVDQTDLLFGKSEEGNRSTYIYDQTTRMEVGIRKGKWKLLVPERAPKNGKHRFLMDFGTDDFELYNLDEDIGESNNVVGEHPEIVAELKELLASQSVIKKATEVVSKKPLFGKQVSESGIRHSFLICGKPTVIVSEDNEIVWKTEGAARDGFVLENGNVLVSIGGKNVAKEITRAGEVVWSYQLSKENKEIGSAVRLENGNTLVVERGTKPQLLEITPDGSIALTVPLQPETENGHMQTRMARKLDNGNYLVPHLLAFAVKEYSPDGTVVKTFKTDLEELGGREARNWPFTAIRLQNGNTLVNLTNGNKTVEFDAEGKVVWRVDNSDVDGRFADPCGGQRLGNGNTVICSYGQRKPTMAKLFEVTTDKNVVWEYINHAVRAHEVHVLTTNGKPEGALK